jgi:septal ring factor EnvC (AmiA/AmiB activator)
MSKDEKTLSEIFSGISDLRNEAMLSNTKTYIGEIPDIVVALKTAIKSGESYCLGCGTKTPRFEQRCREISLLTKAFREIEQLQAKIKQQAEQIQTLVAGIGKVNDEGVKLRAEIKRLKEDKKHIVNCLDMYHDHCKNDMQVCGINNTAQIILTERTGQ